MRSCARACSTIGDGFCETVGGTAVCAPDATGTMSDAASIVDRANLRIPRAVIITLRTPDT
jgi:hypothetical protein